MDDEIKMPFRPRGPKWKGGMRGVNSAKLFDFLKSRTRQFFSQIICGIPQYFRTKK
jgi:hypothetical protein